MDKQIAATVCVKDIWWNKVAMRRWDGEEEEEHCRTPR